MWLRDIKTKHLTGAVCLLLGASLGSCAVGLCPAGDADCAAGSAGAPHLRLLQTARLPLGPCTRFAVGAVAADGTTAYVPSVDLHASFSGLSPALAYASAADCRTGVNPISSLTLPAGTSSVAFYLKSATLGTVPFSIGSDSPSIEGSDSPLTVFSQPQNLAIGFNSFVRTVSPTPDSTNRAYFGGDFTRFGALDAPGVARLKADGTLDSTFAIGTGAVGGNVDAVVATSSGVYVAGGFTSFNGVASNSLVRLRADGSVDTGFATGGGLDAGVNAMAAATDGSGDIFVGGFFHNYHSSAFNSLGRIRSDGSINTAFSIGGGLYGGSASVILPLPSGSVFVGGTFTGDDWGTASRIAKYDATGTPAAGFSSGGGFNGAVNGLALDTISGTDYVYVGGSFSNYDGTGVSHLVRLNAATGALDGTFNTGTGFNNDVLFVLAVGGNKILVGGTFLSYNGTPVRGLVRLLSSGAIDATFQNAIFSSGSPCGALATDGSGDLFTVTYSTPQVARLTPTGALSSQFNPTGSYNGDVRVVYEPLDDSGKTYLGGLFQGFPNSVSSTSYFMRLNPDGTVDPTMHSGTGPDGWVGGISPVPDGSGDLYLVGNFLNYDGHNQGGVVKVHADGSYVSTFNGGGTGGFNTWIDQIAPMNDGSGRFYVGGLAFQYNGGAFARFGRMNPDGTLDGTFTVGSGITGSGTAVYGIAVDPVTAKIYVGGDYASYDGNFVSNIARVNTDGTWDSSFAMGTGFNGAVSSIALDANRKLLVGGSFTTYKGSGPAYLIRLNPDGSVDGTLSQGAGFDGTVNAVSLAVDGSGDIFVAGSFSHYAGTAIRGLVRLKADGTLNTAFNQGSGLENVGTYVYPYRDGSGAIFLSGYFSWYNGYSTGQGIRILPNGQPY